MTSKRAAIKSIGLNPHGDALLIVDVINDLAFAGGEKVLPWAERLARPLLRTRSLCRRLRIPVIYANDNFGLWHADRSAVIAHCTRRGARGAGVSRRLRPGKGDYFFVKPKHSAFYCTPLVPLLEHLERGSGEKRARLIIAGMATNMCVLATAHDAAIHGYPLIVLSDCCAAESDFDHNVVLSQLDRYFKATICKASELSGPA